jgi:ATP-binding cassette, subfamily F, member 3
MQHLQVHIHNYEVGGNLILSEAECIINARDRIGVVGANGAGKSTLMKLITGEFTHPEAHILNTGSLRLGYLSQIHFDSEDQLVRANLRGAFGDILALEWAIDAAAENMDEEGWIERYTELIEQFNMVGGYDYDREIDRVCRGLGIFELLDRSVREVSGGQRTKIALAKVLLSRPDFLFLDEPTNFIDLESVEWLEHYLEETWKGGYMIISHDREFLDRTTELTFEIRGKKLSTFTGNYTEYRRTRAKEIAREYKLYDEQRDHLKSEKDLINRFRAGSRAGFAKSRERALEKVEVLAAPEEEFKVTFSWTLGEDTPDRVLWLKELFIGRAEPLFFISDLTIGRRDRIGIVGPNGAGKSTCIKTILGSIPQLEGRIVHGKGVEIAYYSQMHEELNMETSLYANYERLVGAVTRERLAGIIGYYGFSYHDLDTPVGLFSGGQISKILFAILWQKRANFLIFDEPTNHLDYDTRESLEKSLRGYPWAILFISHDRYFVNRLATHLWIINKGEVSLCYGNYNDYQLKLERGIDFDMSLWQEDGELDMVLQDKLGKNEAKRIKQKFARKWD